MPKRRLISNLILLSMLALSALPVSAQQTVDDTEPPALLSLFVFVDQSPVADATVLINGELLGTTNSVGRVTGDIETGQRQLVIKTNSFPDIQRDILFTGAEVIQILVNQFSNGRSPFIDIETSNPGKSQTGAKPQQELDADPGILEGRVTNIETGKPLAGVRVFVSGTPQEVSTDEDGQFKFELPPGEYAISVLASRFNTRTLEGIPVQSNDSTTQLLELTPAGSELPEFVVVEPYVEGSLASVLEERREEASVADYLGAEQISRNGDGNVASALQRVTGLTLVNGEFVFIRGLGERYSATLLNGADVPSPDPTRRVVPLGLFPTSIVQSIEVQKGFTPEQVADFGGGVVEIRTRSIPEENFFRIGISGTYNDQTTFKNGLRSEGGGSDLFGFDDGSRNIPAGIEQALADDQLFRFSSFTGEGLTPEQLETLGESLPVNYSVEPQTIEPGFGLDISGGMKYDFDWFKLGWLSAVSLSNDWQTTSEVRRVFASTTATDSGLTPIDDFVFDITERSVDLSGFSSVGAEFGEHHSLTFNGILLRNTTDENEVQTGFSNEFGTDVLIREIEFEERELQFYQLVGDHVLPWWNESTFDWQYSLSSASSDIPDFRSNRFEFDPSSGQFEFATLPNGNQRTYTELDDSGESLNLNFGFNIGHLESDYHGTVKVGYANVQRDRESQVRRIRFNTPGGANSSIFPPGIRQNPLDGILIPEFIDPDGFEIEDNTAASDFYTADLESESIYYGLDLSLFGFLRLYGGVRDERFFQEVATFDPTGNAEPVTSVIDTGDLLPGITATVSLPWETEIRLGFAETVNRPQFRELTPAIFVDPILDNLAVGNPSLLPASITHYDLRIDKYFSELEFVSLSFFYKEFTQPIEQLILAGPDALITFGNVPSAENIGFEFEYYKDLSFFGGLWENVYTSANFAYIESTVDLDFAVGNNLTSQERALQGQSPYVVNAQIGYQNPDTGLTATLLYNTAGKRIVQVGTNNRPDIFEQPFNQLDFVVRYKLDDWVLRLNARNLLDDQVEFSQGAEITRSFARGREISLGVQYTFD